MRMIDLEKRLGIPKRKIHFYIQEGLIHPAKSQNNYYDFKEKDVETIELIIRLRSLGMSISSIKSLFHYPTTVNYEVYSTIRRLKEEIKERQHEIESLLQLTEQIPPTAKLDQLPQYMDTLSENTLKFDIDAIYPISETYMLTIFLCVPFVVGQPTVYQRYLWNKISKELEKCLGSEVKFLNKIVDHMDISSLNEISSIAALSINSFVNNMTGEQQFEDYKNKIYRFLNNPELIKKWNLLYHPITTKLAVFYQEQANLFEVYNPIFAKYTLAADETAKRVLQECSELIEELKQALCMKEIEYFDIVSIYSFENHFYNYLNFEELEKLLGNSE